MNAVVSWRSLPIVASLYFLFISTGNVLALPAGSLNSLAQTGSGGNYCEDLNGDGIPDQLDTDVHGESYCLSITWSTPLVGSEVLLNVNAYHEAGIEVIDLIEDRDYINGKFSWSCEGRTHCSFQIPVASQFEGQKLYTCNFFKSPFRFAAAEDFSLQFICAEEYCQPDPKESDFTAWLREKGYPECIVDAYLNWIQGSQSRPVLLPFFHDRGAAGRLEPGQTVHIYDMIPTDPETTYASIGVDNIPSCRASAEFPEFCPTPLPADHYFLERHFERTFGIDFDFEYHPVYLSYVETFGEPALLGGYYRFGARWTFLSQNNFEDHSIIHYAIKSYRGSPIADMTGSSSVAEMGKEPDSIFGARTYTHEFGHTFKLQHPFIYSPYTQFQLDGIMSNTYERTWTGLDPLDPLERYALEPEEGSYLDDAVFAAQYSQAAIGTYPLEQCDYPDPAIRSVSWIEAQDQITLKVTLTNYGLLTAYYVPLRVLTESEGNPVASRLIPVIFPGQQIVHEITLGREILADPSVQVILDPEATISADNTGNNSAAVSLYDIQPELFVRGDVNGDLIVNLSDLKALRRFLYRNTQPNNVLDALDVNDDGQIGGKDLRYLRKFLRNSGPAPYAPYPEPGYDPTPDSLPGSQSLAYLQHDTKRELIKLGLVKRPKVRK
jgi:hypothetical protein